MVAITSKVGVCNMAIGHLGNKGTIDNIDTPTNDKEITFALWYDISRQTLLKILMPNFALERVILPALVSASPFGYTKEYNPPFDCLKILGIGNVDEKGDVSYSFEGGKIKTDAEYPNGLPLRYVKDITDVTKWSADFKMTFSLYLASKVCKPLGIDAAKKKEIEAMLPIELATTMGLNAQENPPIRKSVSRFRQARYSDPARNAEKL